MWNWADDHGRAEWTPMELMAFAFPHDSESPTFITEFPRILTEVANTFSVEFYINDERRFYSITRWDEHQRNERRASSRFPAPDDPESAPDKEFYGNHGFTDNSRGDSAHTDGVSALGTGEQGNRGTGEQSNKPPVVPLEGDTTSKDDSSTSKRRTSKTLIPDGWHPSEHHVKVAAEKHIDLATEYEKFRAYSESNAKRYANWDQAFNNWLLNCDNFNRGQHGYVNRSQQRYEKNMQRVRNAQIAERAKQPQLTGGSDNAFGF